MFLFYRNDGIERDGGYLLAGKLVVDLPKDAEANEANKAMVASIAQELTQRARCRALAPVTIGWERGERPPKGVDVDSDAALERWASDRFTIGLRVEPPDATGDALISVARDFQQ
jgi:hypothetical protein